MALDTTEQEILKQLQGRVDATEQGILDAIIQNQSGSGGGGVPGSVIAPEAAPIQPGIPILPEGVEDGRFSGEPPSLSGRVWGGFKNYFSDFSEGVQAVDWIKESNKWAATMLARPILLSLDEKRLKHAQENFRGTEALFEAMDYLDRPRRVITNVAFRNAEILGEFAADTPFLFQQKNSGLITPRFTSIGDAIKKGWSGEDSVSLRKAVSANVIGVDLENKLEAWTERHWQLKYPRITADFISNMAADAAIDFGISRAVLIPVRAAKAGALRYGTQGMKDAILKMSKSKLDEGAEAVFAAAANDISNLQGPTRRSIDDMIQESIDNAPDIAPVATVFQASEVEIAAQQSKLLVDRVRVGQLKSKIDDLSNQIRRFDGVQTEDEIQELLRRQAEINSIDVEDIPGEIVRSINKEKSDISTLLDATFNPLDAQGDILNHSAGFKRFKLESRRQLLADQLVEATKKADESRAILSEIQRLGHAVDYKGTTRAMREAYVDATIKGITEADDIESIRHFIRLASGGVTDDIAELSDEGMDALFDFINARATDKSAWGNWAADAPGVTGRIKRIARRTANNQVVSPAWQVFRRLNAERMYQFVDDAFFNKYAHIERSLSDWEVHVSTLPKKGRGQTASLRKVFLIADGRMTSIDDAGTATFNVTKGKVAKESWITPVSPEELAAGNFVNKEAKVFADMAVAQGRLSHTGKDAPKVIDHYITHSFDRAVVDAGNAREAIEATIKELRIKAGEITDLNALKLINDEIEELTSAATGGTQVSLQKIADLFEHTTKTDVNIPEFLRRINAREGLIENADPAFRTMLGHEAEALYMQPAYRAANAMAGETGNENLIKFTRQWINDIRGVPRTGFVSEASLEPLAQDISGLLQDGTKWIPWQRLQWQAEDRAIRQFSRVFRSASYTAAMGFNPGPVATNMTQSMLTVSAIGWKSTLKGFESLTTTGGKSALRHSRLLIGRNPMHSISLREMSRLSKASGWTFRTVDHWMNVAPAFNGSLYKQLAGNADKMAILRKYGVPEGRGFWDTLGKALDAGEFVPEKDVANRIAKLTQYSYLRHDAPTFLRSPLGALFGQFLSWPANYWQSYMPEMAKWMATGTSPFGELGPIARATLLRHILLAETIIQAGDQAGIDLKRHRPVSVTTDVGGLPIPSLAAATPQVTPALRILTGFAIIATHGDNQRKMDQGILELKKGFMVGKVGPLPLPFFPAAARRIGRAAEEEDIRPLFFRMSEEDVKSRQQSNRESRRKSRR